MTLPGADGLAKGMGHRSPEMSGQGHQHGGGDQPDTHQSMGHEGHGQMAMPSLGLPAATLWVVFSLAVLLAALLVANLYLPIRF